MRIPPARKAALLALAQFLLILSMLPDSILAARSLGDSSSAAAVLADPLAVRVVGNHLVNQAGQTLVLRGVNRSGSEYACLGSPGAFDGPTDDASINAIASWGLNAVRIPLNEDCWLGLGGATLQGAAYKSAISGFVARLTAHNMYAILDLHWSAPGSLRAGGQEPMADLDHSVAFWRDVAATFAPVPSVLLELYNEPDPIPYSGTYPGGFSAWQRDDFACTRDDCSARSTQGTQYQTAGMQTLLYAVRQAGATNVVLVGGIQDSQTISQYLGDGGAQNGELPYDPLGQTAVAVHSYADDACGDLACWNGTYAPVAARYPVVATEMGDTNGTPQNITAFYGFAVQHGISTLAWNWGTDFGSQSLVKDYSGTPTTYGAAYRQEVLASLRKAKAHRRH